MPQRPTYKELEEIIRELRATERKRVEEALQADRQRTRAILGSITDGFMLVDTQWRLNYFDEAVPRISGMKREDMTGACLWDLFPYGTASKFYSEFRRAVTTNTPVHFEDFYPEPVNRWLECHCYPSEKGLSILICDITRRKKEEDELKKAEEQLRLASEAAGIGTYCHTFEPTLVEWSDQLKCMFGLPLDEPVSLNRVVRRIHPEDRDRVRLKMKASFDPAGSGSFRDDHRIVRPDDEVRWLHVEGRTEFSANKAVRAFGAVHDITERKRNEEILIFKKNIIKSSSSAIATCDMEGNMTYGNPAFHKKWGFRDPKEVIGKPFCEFWLVKDRLGEIGQALQGKGTWSGEVQAKRKDGSIFDLQVSAAMVFDNNAKPIALTFTSVDITERKLAEEALRQLNETLEHRVSERTELAESRAKQLQALISELTLAEQRERGRIAEILHDHQQQLLVAAKINCEVLGAGLETQRRLLAEKIADLIAQSIQISRSLTAELSPPILRQGGLSAALEWLAGWIEQNYGLTVELKTDPSLNPEREDITVLLFSSIRELLINTAKHAGVSSARVEMARDKENTLRLSVSDQGDGFDPDGIWKEAGSKNGFGLFSIRERLELLGGKMEIESAPGTGATFSLIVPLEIN